MDERIDELRGRIDAVDRRLVEDVNERLRLVGELWQVKAELGLDRVDHGREESLRAALRDANAGPLTGDGLDELVTAILALTKREQDRRPV
jgi:chorismate mutase